MDFKAPQAVNQALIEAADNGVNGYYGDDSRYKASVVNWMSKRHDWQVSPDWIVTCAGLVQGTALCVQAYTEPGDGVILFTPVYHAFSKVIKANQRIVVDEIHHDLVFPPNKHTVATLAAPEHEQNMVILAATTKTFNIASALTGAAIIPNPALRDKFKYVLNAAGIGPNRMGMLMATAAYEHGEAWLEALVEYLDENRRIFDEGINSIKGLKSMPLEATPRSRVIEAIARLQRVFAS
jgi:bifunctional pyridoxal-dependent enzyme with beta-cystathionase and maltose regulon repressor activities